MNSSIQAERLAKAIEAITVETKRLGGRFEMPAGRFPDPATKYTLILEAVGAALAAIGAPPAEGAAVVVEPDAPQATAKSEPTAPKGKRKGNL